MQPQVGQTVRYTEAFIDSLRSRRSEEELRARRGTLERIDELEAGTAIAEVTWHDGGHTRAPLRYFTNP